MTRRTLLLLLAATGLVTAAAFTLSQLVGPVGLKTTVGSRADAAAAVQWNGFLYVQEPREYEVRIVSEQPVALWIDSRQIFKSSGSLDPLPSRVRLTAGQHLVGVTFGSPPDDGAWELQWDRGNPYRLETIPPEALSTRSLTPWKWRVRRPAMLGTLAVCTAWSVLMIVAAWFAVWRRAARDLAPSRSLVATLSGLAVLFVVGVWWGGIAGWPADDIDPESVRWAALQGFANGWHDKYPPLHYYLLAVLYFPTIVADAFGWLTVESDSVQLAMVVTGRLLTVIMALTTVVAVALLATRVLDSRHAWVAALCAGTFLPFPFYAKTTNVDLPYTCWFAWSLVFLLELFRSHRMRDAIALGVTAAAAVATKDQAYGLYLLPAAALLWKFGTSRGGWRVLLAGAGAAGVTLALAYNVLFNPHGLRDHLAFISGPASTGYRMFEPTLAGQWSLLETTTGQLLAAVGVAGLALVALSAGSLHYARARVPFLLLAAATVSYYLTFIAFAGYVYDRFLLPITCMLALCAAIGSRRLLDGSIFMRIAGIVLLTWIAGRAAAVDIVLVRDSRLAVEAWLASHVQRNEVVAAVNQYGYIPRLYRFRRAWVPPTIDGTKSLLPDYIVVNREHAARFGPGTEEYDWIVWLESGGSPYEEVFRYKTPLTWTPLALDSRFTDRVQDPFTNLDKANPETVIFRKR